MSGPDSRQAPAPGVTPAKVGSRDVVANLLREGLAQQRAGKLEQAAKTYGQVIALAPTYAPARHLLGLAEYQRGQFDRALAQLRHVADAAPANPDYLCDLGMVLAAMGRHSEAERALVAARRLRPGDVRTLNILASVFMQLRQREDAAECYRAAIAAAPQNVAMHNNLGNVLSEMGQTAAAIESFRQALALDPAYVEAHSNLAHALTTTGALDEAIVQCEEALRLQPNSVGARFNLAMALRGKGRLAEATEAFRAALALNPRSVQAAAGFGAALADAGRTADAIEQYELALRHYPDDQMLLSNLLFLKNYLAETDPAAMVEQARRYGRLLASAVFPQLPFSNTPDPERRLRVGLVSGDFCTHAVARFLQTTLAAIDPQKIELFAYATTDHHDAVTDRLRESVPNWRRVDQLRTQQIVDTVRADHIDILVDLSGHSANHRLSVFAAKPAPIAATWLGYFATTGVAAIDYVLANRWVIPEGEEGQWVEKPWRLPETYLCFTPPGEVVAVKSLPARANGHVTFGSFNNLNKLSPRTVEVWAGLLREVPRSRLLLRSEALSDRITADLLRQRFATLGVEAERLLLEGHLHDYAAHLETYNRLDIALDPFPYAGGTTSVEALWMGVPVLTLKGDRYVSHMGESILQNLGMPEWIAATPDDYVAKAAAFVADLDGLAALRAELRDRVSASPLMDAPRFAGHLEEAFRGMWRKWCATRPPVRLTVTF